MGSSRCPQLTKNWVAEAYHRFADQERGGLDRHGLKCAYVAVVGRRPCRLQLELLLARATESPGSDTQLVHFEAFSNGMDQVLGAARSGRTPSGWCEPTHQKQAIFESFVRPKGLGFITRAAAHSAFHESLPHVSPHVVDEVFDEVDRDADGRVGARDFMAIFTASGAERR